MEIEGWKQNKHLRLIWSQVETLTPTDLIQNQEFNQWNFNQKLESIENEFSSVKKFLSLSPRQQNLFCQTTQQEDAKENLLEMVRGISQIYSQLDEDGEL